jgi:hypothetical protein
MAVSLRIINSYSPSIPEPPEVQKAQESHDEIVDVVKSGKHRQHGTPSAAMPFLLIHHWGKEGSNPKERSFHSHSTLG